MTTALAAALLVVGCGALRTTDRVFNGQTVEGYYIAPEAYAAYVEGAYREARGEWAQAEQAYQRALRSDGQSPQIWTRLGVLACRDSLPRAQEHFDRALALDPFAPAWTELARCLAARRQPMEALAAALNGARLDPKGAHSNLLVVRLYRETAQPGLARDWLFAWLLLEPELETMAEPLNQEAHLLGDAALSSLAATILRRHAARGHPPAGEPPPASAVANALLAGELERARELASEAGISPLKLAMLSLEAGRADLALTQAELVARANPGDSAALITALAAAALLQDQRRFRELLRETQSDELPPRELAQRFSTLLRASVGDEAADSWRSAYLRALAFRATPP